MKATRITKAMLQERDEQISNLQDELTAQGLHAAELEDEVKRLEEALAAAEEDSRGLLEQIEHDDARSQEVEANLAFGIEDLFRRLTFASNLLATITSYGGEDRLGAQRLAAVVAPELQAFVEEAVAEKRFVAEHVLDQLDEARFADVLEQVEEVFSVEDLERIESDEPPNERWEQLAQKLGVSVEVVAEILAAISRSLSAEPESAPPENVEEDLRFGDYQ